MLVAIIVGLAVAFALSVAQLGTVLPAYQDRFTAFLDDLEAWLATLGIGRDQLKAALGQISFGNIAGFFTDLLVGLAGAFSNLLLLLLIVLFMGLDATYFSRRLTRAGAELPPSHNPRSRIERPRSSIAPPPAWSRRWRQPSCARPGRKTCQLPRTLSMVPSSPLCTKLRTICTSGR